MSMIIFTIVLHVNVTPNIVLINAVPEGSTG